MFGVEHHQVGKPARRYRSGIAAKRLRATRQGALVKVQRDRCSGTWLRRIACPRLQPADVVEPAQLLDRTGADIGIAADTETAVSRKVFAQGEDAVTEIGLGRLAQSRDGSACRKALRFRRIDVRRMHQAPAMIDRRMIQQPVDRPCTAPGNAVDHLLLLLGDMDVNWPATRIGDRCVEFLRRNRAQRMRCEADGCAGAPSSRTDRHGHRVRG